MIKAYAGTGKSSSLRLLAEANPNLRILYIVFNKAMADEAARSFPDNAICRTSHSIAFETHGKQFAGRINPIRAKDLSRELHFKDIRISVSVIETLENWFHSADPIINETHVVGEDSDRTEIAAAANQTWLTMLDEAMALPMPHDGYQKLWSLSSPHCSEFDLLLIDEAQDLNPVVLDYALRSANELGVPVVFVGDHHQSIYSWRGAIDAMTSVEAHANHILTLTHSFRFGQKIADHASVVLNRLKDDPVRIVGAGTPTPTPDEIQCCILGRTNFALIERALAELSADAEMRFHFAATNKRENWSPRIPYRFQDLLDVLSIYQGSFADVRSHYFRKFASWEEILDYVAAGDMELKFLSKIVTDYGDALPDVLSKLEAASTSPLSGDLHLSTAHRAKGLEWDVVELLDDFKRPTDLLDLIQSPETDTFTLQWALEEANLLYVGITRAKLKLSLPSSLAEWISRECPK